MLAVKHFALQQVHKQLCSLFYVMWRALCNDCERLQRIVVLVCVAFSGVILETKYLLPLSSMFSVIEFKEEDGGGLAIVNTQWLTPRKKEVFWPPITNSNKFNKCLRAEFTEAINTETWKLYSVHKIYSECDNLETANWKLKRAQEESDVNSADEIRKRRKRLPLRLLDSSDSDDNNNYSQAKHKRPSPIKSRSAITSTPTTSEKVILKLSTPTVLRPNRSQDLCTPSTVLRPNTSQDLSTPASTSWTNNISQDKNEYHLLLKEILKIKEQNKQILSLLNNRNLFGNPSNSEFPEDFPCSLPLTNIKDLETVEKVLSENPRIIEQLVAHFSTRGGKDLRTKTNSLLRNLMTDELASNYNYYGLLRKDRNETHKKPFKKLHINTVVIRSVKHNSDLTTDSIEMAIKSWLKHAPQRKQNKSKSAV